MKFIAMEAGGTHSRAALFDGDILIAAAEGGPCNPVAYGWEPSLQRLCRMISPWTQHSADVIVLAGIAGAADDDARTHAAQELTRRLGCAEALVTEDIWAMLHANAARRPTVLAIAGTGSNVAAFDGASRWVQLGGRGHVFGDDGSAYALGIAGLRALASAEDGLGPETALHGAIIQAAGCAGSKGLIAWSGQAAKADIAALAPVVVRVAEAGDAVAAALVQRCAEDLIALVRAAMRALNIDTATIVGHGGMFENAAAFRACFDALEHPFEMARLQGPAAVAALREFTGAATLPPWLMRATRQHVAAVTTPVTEALADNARLLDEMSAEEIASSIGEGGLQAARAVCNAATELSALIERAAQSLRDGGRIFYVGAGTSGRLGVLDAAECPPTFGVPTERVQGILAGGHDALVRSIEGAEDDAAAGAQAIEAAEAGPNDIVIGIAASGNTPFVAGALARAAEAGAPTALVTSNPDAHVEAQHRVVLDTGAELLAGSTRMKAGTAAKIALNVISTGAMARAGFVWRGRMIGMRPVNNKLRQRAVAIVAELAGVGEAPARTALEATGYHIASAILVARDAIPAKRALEITASAPSPRDAVMPSHTREGKP
jgi:N-acetylmuramic acid 6-phosphate etherase